MGPMAGMGGMGMMRGFQHPQTGGPEQDQWQRPSPDQPRDQLKFRPEIKRFDGSKEKGAKGDQPKAKRDKPGKDKKEKMSKGKKKADKDDEGDDEENEDNEKENDNNR